MRHFLKIKMHISYFRRYIYFTLVILSYNLISIMIQNYKPLELTVKKKIKSNEYKIKLIRKNNTK